jgi:ribosomal protein S30
MSRKRDIEKGQIFENDDPITIRPSQLKLLIRECLEASIEKIRLNELNDEKGSITYSKEELENMSAAQLKKIANQKAADEKVTIRVTGRSKIPTKQDNINFLLQETPPDETVELSTSEKNKKKAVYDPQKKVYVSGKNAANEKGEVYGRLLKSGKVRPFTPDERAQISKNKIPLIQKNTQNEVNKYRKDCEKKELDSESESN